MPDRLMFPLLAAVAPVAAPAAADPLPIASGRYAIDIEGDFFRFAGDGFSLPSVELLTSPAKLFQPRCVQCHAGAAALQLRRRSPAGSTERAA
jgi:hypothetical protein